MSTPAYLPGVTSRTVETPRLRQHALAGGSEQGVPVVFVHGNVSSSRFFEETLSALPPQYWGLAPDLRGFGDSETLPVDATRGLRDFGDDLHALFEALGLGPQRKVHLAGWSMGGGIVMQYAIDHPDLVASVTLIDPLSPYGFGGTRDTSGAFCWPDAAGSGGGTANPDYVKRLAEKDRGEESPNSPRNVMNAFYFKPPFRVAPEREEIFVDALLTTVVGEGNYPGDATTSENWPTAAPGTRGVNNAMVPTYCDLSGFAAVTPQPPVLWVRGADDQIVSDSSFLDFGTLGQLGFVPGWPGADVYPPQPMVSQMRAVLDRYQANGGLYEELVIAECGHSPLIEHPEEFRAALWRFLSGTSAGASNDPAAASVPAPQAAPEPAAPSAPELESGSASEPPVSEPVPVAAATAEPEPAPGAAPSSESAPVAAAVAESAPATATRQPASRTLFGWLRRRR